MIKFSTSLAIATQVAQATRMQAGSHSNQAAKELFNTYDVDKDMFLNSDEFQTAYVLEFNTQALIRDVHDAFQKLDANEDNKVDCEEFETLYCDKFGCEDEEGEDGEGEDGEGEDDMNPDGDFNWKELFEKYDKDGDNKLSKEEYKDIYIKEWCYEGNDECVANGDEDFQWMDENQDGFVDYEEFLNAFDYGDEEDEDGNEDENEEEEENDEDGGDQDKAEQIEEMYTKYDKDGDGCLTIEEFAALYEEEGLGYEMDEEEDEDYMPEPDGGDEDGQDHCEELAPDCENATDPFACWNDEAAWEAYEKCWEDEGIDEEDEQDQDDGEEENQEDPCEEHYPDCENAADPESCWKNEGGEWEAYDKCWEDQGDGDEMEPDDGDEMEPDDGDEMEPDDGDEMEPDEGDEEDWQDPCEEHYPDCENATDPNACWMDEGGEWAAYEECWDGQDDQEY